MARKTARKAAPIALSTIADLTPDADNPRFISDEAAAGLGKSLERFGDLSGIVWNKRTRELVTGHQRVKQITTRWPEARIDVSEEDGSGRIVLADGTFFAIRVVDWSQAMQRAANVTANNLKLQGKFTKNLSTYLLSVEAELSQEAPGVLDDCLLVELLAAGMDLTDATEPAEEFGDGCGGEPTCGELGTEIKVGTYRFSVTIPEYERWEAQLRAEHGTDKDTLCAAIAQRLQIALS